MPKLLLYACLLCILQNKCRELEHCSYLFLNRLSGAAAPLTQLLSPSLLLDKASDLEQRDGSPVFEIRRHALTALTAVIGNVCKFGCVHPGLVILACDTVGVTKRCGVHS